VAEEKKGGGGMTSTPSRSSGKSWVKRMRATLGKHRWVSVVIIAGLIIALVGTVLGNVILTYNIFNNVAANANSHYEFVNGANYAAASALGVYTDVIPAVPTQVTTTLAGIQYANVEVYDVLAFEVELATTTTSHVTAVTVVNPAVIAVPGVVCAYAFVSDALPSAGTVAVAGEPVGCLAVTPTLGAIGTACTAGGSATGVATINLLSDVVTGTPGTCNVPTADASGNVLEYVSFAIYVNAAVAAAGLNTIGINVGAP
jgi:hypothetical protein